MYTATVFEKSARHTTLDKYFKKNKLFEKRCELVNEKSLPVQFKV
jgi:hypothetical protein